MDGLMRIKKELKDGRKLISAFILIFLAGAAVRSMTAGYPYLIGADPYYHLRFAEYMAFNHSFPAIDPLGWYPDQPVVNPPLLYLILALPHLLTGRISVIATVNYINLFAFALTLAGVFLISRKMLKPGFALLAALFYALSPEDATRSLVGLFRPENIALTLFILSTLTIWREGRVWKAALFAMSASITLIWTAYPVLIVPLLVISVIEDRHNKNLKNTLAAAGGLLLGLMAFWIRLYMRYGLPKNLEVYGQIQELISPLEGLTISGIPQWILTGDYSFSMGTFVFLLFIGGLVIGVLKYRDHTLDRRLGEVIIASVLFLVFSLQYGRFIHILIPFSSIIAAYTMEDIFGVYSEKDTLTSVLLIGFLVMTVLFTVIPLYGVYDTFRVFDDPKVMNSNREQFYLWMGTLSEGVVLSHSDDGHYITALAGQKVVADNNIVPYSKLAERTMERFRDIGRFYLALDYRTSYDIARSYNASYVLVDPLYQFQIEPFSEISGEEVPHPDATVLMKLIGKEENSYFRLLKEDNSTKYSLLLYEVSAVPPIEPPTGPAGTSNPHNMPPE